MILDEIWEDWPNGEESPTEYESFSCPICHSELIPARRINENTSYYSSRRTIYITLCLKCKTVYLRSSTETLNIPETLPYMIQQEERISKLEATVNMLIQEVRLLKNALTKQRGETPQAPTPRAISHSNTQEFTSKYAYLLQ